MAASLMCLTFKEPLLQIRLAKDHLPVWLVGVIFSMDTISYTLTSFVLNFFPENKKEFKKLVYYGTILFVICMFLEGPVKVLPNSVVIIAIGIWIGGIGGALINNHCVPALTVVLGNKHNLDKSLIKNYISAINTGAFGLGSILGPILASVLESALDFQTSFTIMGVLVIAVSCL